MYGKRLNRARPAERAVHSDLGSCSRPSSATRPKGCIAGFASLRTADGDELMVRYEQLPERAKELFRDEARGWLRIFEAPDDAGHNGDL
jgi:hypothetical protein